jgi:hypothetical protein
MFPAIPFEEGVAGIVFDMTIFAQNAPNGTVLTEAADDGLRKTITLSVTATLAAVANSETFLLLSAIYITN